MSDVLNDFDEDDAEDTGLPDNKSVDEKAESLVKKVARLRRLAGTSQSHWRTEARKDFAFLAGDQWTDEERNKLTELSRIDVVFNRIEPTIESIAGHEVNNRTSVKYLPRQPNIDAQVNELLTNAADWVRDRCDAEDEESDAFVDMLSCGVGATRTQLDYDENPDGEIVIDRIDPLKARWDPAARKRNLADRTWHQFDLEMTLAEIREQWPEAADEVTAANVDSASLSAAEDEEPHNATEAPFYRRDQSEKDTKRNFRTVVMHEWYETKPFWRVLDPTTGQITDLPDEDYQRVMQAASVGLTQPPGQAVKLKKRVYRVAFICDNVLLEERESITQKGFLINFITGRRDRNRNSWYGVVRPMRDPQRFANKYLSQLEAIIRSNAKGGLLVEEGATNNFKELENKWAQQDSVIVVNDGALSQGKIQPKTAPPLPQGPERLLEFSISSIRDVTGVNLEALGLADRNQPGVLEMQRRESALTILAPLFNSLRRYRKEQGRVLADLIIRYISDGRLIRIVQGDGTEQSVPLLRMPETMDYDVVVDSSSNAPDQKARTFAIMSTLIPALEKSGFPTPPEILDYTPLPQSLVMKWKQAIQQKMAQPPQPPPEVLKAQIQAAAEVEKAKIVDTTKRLLADMDSKREVYLAGQKAIQEAQAEQLRAAINEQSQIINAQANEAKSAAAMLEARLNGLSKLIDATSRVRASADKQVERAEKANKGPSVIAMPMPMQDNGASEMQAAALQQMATAVQTLQQAVAGPKPPLRVIRDSNGNIQGVQ